MDNKKSFEDSKILTFSNYFLSFFLNTVYFYICISPLIILYLIPYGFNVTKESKGVLIPMLVFVGPALTGLYGAMSKLVKYGEANFLKDYFKAYIEGFKQSIIVWAIDIIIITVLSVDISFFPQLKLGSFDILAYFFIIIFAICIGIVLIASLYIFPIISQFNLKTRYVLKFSIYNSVIHIKRTLLMIIIAAAGLCIFKLIPGISILFLPGIFTYLSTKILVPIFENIEKNIVLK